MKKVIVFLLVAIATVGMGKAQSSPTHPASADNVGEAYPGEIVSVYNGEFTFMVPAPEQLGNADIYSSTHGTIKIVYRFLLPDKTVAEGSARSSDGKVTVFISFRRHMGNKVIYNFMVLGRD